MPIEDQEMFKFLSSKIISNEAILKPDIDKIISEEEELKSNRTNHRKSCKIFRSL